MRRRTRKGWSRRSVKLSTTISRTAKGSFNIRTGPDLHRRAVVAASRAGITLNAFVTRALEAAVADALGKPAGR
jgi:predicted HicB family RNase H-like nuclease